jgi:translation elongation factor EF-G
MEKSVESLGFKKVCLSVIVTVILTVSGGLGGWTYSQVRDLPKNYVPRTELVSALDKISLDLRVSVSESKDETRREVQKLREDLRAINERLDSVIKLLIQKNVSYQEQG